MIVSIVNPKGGVGKTTLAINLAMAFKYDNKDVVLVDPDSQGSARDWQLANDKPLLKMIAIDRPTIDKTILALASKHDWVFIDGAVKLEAKIASVIKLSNVLLIPIQPSALDVWGVADLVEIIKARRSVTRGKPKAAFVISRQIANTTIGKEIRETLQAYKLHVFKAGTFQRIAYVNSITEGKSVLDFEPSGLAAQEMRAISNELQEFING